MSNRVCYTRELLLQAAEQCTSIDEAIAFVGARPYGGLRRYLMRRFASFGIDISHFSPCASKILGRPTPQELDLAVTQSRSLAETLRHLGRPDNTSQRLTLRRSIAEDGLSTAHFLGQGHQRGRTGWRPRKSADATLVKHDGQRRTRTVRLRRALLEVGVPECCDRCGTTAEWHGKPMTLEIDHINGDWSDDRRENLRLLCPNCHAITSTWCRGSRPISRPR